MLLRFFKYLYLYLNGTLSRIQFGYLVREGTDVRLAASYRWSAELRVKDKPPETEREKILPLKNHTIILKDLTGLKPDTLIYQGTDSEKAEAAISKIKYDLFNMPCHEFYEKWVVHPNFDFLVTPHDRMEMGA
ncbi:MAG: hypothetical protein HRF49_03755 [bacterium]|jgi:hypothetical protein